MTEEELENEAIENRIATDNTVNDYLSKIKNLRRVSHDIPAKATLEVLMQDQPSTGNASSANASTTHNADMTNPSREEMKHALQATQADVTAIAEKLRADFAEHRGDMRTAIADMKAATETLRGDFHKATSENLKWIVITAISLAGATVSILTFVINNAAKVPQVQQPQQQQPVIVNVLPATSTPAAAQQPK